MPEDESTYDMSILWMVHTYGSSIKKMGRVGLLITSLEGDILKYGVQLQFPAINNESKYKAILTKLKVVRSLGPKNILLKSDSKLVIGKINGEYEAKESKM